MQLVSNTMVKIAHNHSLSATRVTTVWLKQPICCIECDMQLQFENRYKYRFQHSF